MLNILNTKKVTLPKFAAVVVTMVSCTILGICGNTSLRERLLGLPDGDNDVAFSVAKNKKCDIYAHLWIFKHLKLWKIKFVRSESWTSSAKTFACALSLWSRSEGNGRKRPTRTHKNETDDVYIENQRKTATTAEPSEITNFQTGLENHAQPPKAHFNVGTYHGSAAFFEVLEKCFWPETMASW